MAISTPNLSANDTRILSALFDPETLPSSVAKSKDASNVDASLPPHPTIPASTITTLEQQQAQLITRVTCAPPSHQPTVIAEAMNELESLIEEWPTYASPYLNRAMLRRLSLESAYPSHPRTIFSAPPPAIALLFTDLATALSLALPSCPTSPISPFAARTLRTAYAHRAYLYLKAAEVGASLNGKGKAELEELASVDFAAAGRLGDDVAREMSVRTNPYKKMCGAIVREALREEGEGR